MSYPHVLDRLRNGEEVVLHPSGSSMTPRIEPKQEITLIPIDRIQVGDIVLAKVNGRYFIHLITAIEGDRVQISNNHKHVNGWTHKARIYGRVKDV